MVVEIPTNKVSTRENGEHVGADLIDAYGRNLVVGQTTEDVWIGGGVLVWPTTAAVISVTGGAQDAAGGTGVLTIEIHGLDANWDEIEETVIMTGATPALTTQSFIRVNFAHAATWGANGVASANIVGTISGNPQFTIGTGRNETVKSHYSSPRRKHSIIKAVYWAVGGSKDVIIKYKFRKFGDIGFFTIKEVQVNNTVGELEIRYGFLPEKTDFVATALTDVGNASVSAGMIIEEWFNGITE